MKCALMKCALIKCALMKCALMKCELMKCALMITINVPVVYIVRDIVVLWRANPFPGPFEGVGPKSQDFFFFW